ncbi:MAG: serine protein kinase RIO [Candidatus Woesearchaeota archaeon]
MKRLEKRPPRMKKGKDSDRFKAYENVFDESTLRALHKLSSQGYFDELLSPIKIGKESNVFSALKDGEKRIIKVYRTSANFKKMYEYMAPDPRFSGLKKNSMNIIFTWAKKEYRNLLKARGAGVKVPTPYAVYKNIVVMEHIGEDDAAPQLNKHKPSFPKEFYETLIKDILALYHKAGLVHADLSAFNVLNHDDKPVIIDFSHAVGLSYPNVKDLLRRDLSIIASFFKRLNVDVDVEKELEKCKAKS